MERSILATQIRRESDVAFAAQRAQLVASQLGAASKQARAFGKAVQEIAGNALVHAGGGKFRLSLIAAGGVHELEALLSDSGPGCQQADSLAENSPGSKKSGTRGIGYAQQCVDRFAMGEGPQGGTAVRLGIELPGPPAIDKEVFVHWASPLARTQDSAALVAALGKIAVLGGKLAAAAQREKSLETELDTLRASHETLSLLAVVASKTDSAVIVMDRHTRVEWVNAGFVRLTGYTPAEVAGSHPFDFLHGPQTDTVGADEIAAAFEAPEGHSQELLHYRKDGGTYWASLSITPVFDEDGQLSRWICIFSDITRRREAQAALERAREAAEAASRAKSEFLANMSHEIRTPMNAVIGMTELALLTDLTPEQREYLVIAKESAESLLRLLNEILDLSKIEAGKIEIDCVEFNLTELLEDTMKALAVRAKQKGLELAWEPPQEVKEYLMGDPVRLRQILINLVDNAIKFTDHGQVMVRVEPQWQTGREVGLRFSVTDTGIGIPAAELDRIFEGFTQGDSSTTRRFGGTGLGLTISSHLVRLMQGQMRVQSQEGKGSAFHFVLRLGVPPRRSSTDDHCERRRSVAMPVLSSAAPERILRVLVADDNAANRILAERLLQKRGHCTTAARNGQQVLEAFRRHDFDVVLLDVQMPDMDGFATTAAIRRMERHSARRVPVIAMTAYAMKGDRERCLAAGMDGYLAKPLGARELIALVESMTAAEPEPHSADEPATGASLDFTLALARVEGDREILKEQMECFLRDVPMVLAEVGDAAAGKDGKRLERAAHRLKGLAAGFDATEMTDCARRVEDAARGNDFRRASVLCGELAAEAAELQQRIRAYLAPLAVALQPVTRPVARGPSSPG